MIAARRPALRRYAEAIDLWQRGHDSASIARALGLSEGVVARWIANWNEMVRV